MFLELFKYREFYFNQKQFNFKIEKLDLLTKKENLNQAVNKYKIQYISKKTNEILFEYICVGKHIKRKNSFFNNSEFEKYYNKFKLLKKLKLINYSFKLFKSIEGVDCINFNVYELTEMIFLKDLTPSNGEILPSNKLDEFNIEIIQKYGFEIWKIVFNEILKSSLILLEKNIICNYFDVWMVSLNKNKDNLSIEKIKLDIVDLDNLVFKNTEISISDLENFFFELNRHIENLINEENYEFYRISVLNIFSNFVETYNHKIELIDDKRNSMRYKFKLSLK